MTAPYQPNQPFGFISILLLWLGVFVTAQNYGWIYLLVYFPAVFSFGYFLGLPQLINVLRVRRYVPRWRMTCLFQAILIYVLYQLLFVLGVAGHMFAFLMVFGAVAAFAMPRKGLISERVELESSRAADRMVDGLSDDQIQRLHGPAGQQKYQVLKDMRNRRAQFGDRLIGEEDEI